MIEILKQVTINYNTVTLPSIQLKRNEYLEIKKLLNNIGGIYKGGKKQYFEFEYNPTEFINAIINGESINLKKEYQFFETPIDLVNKMMDLIDITSEDKVLEPSAGRGVIVKKMLEKTQSVYCFEKMFLNKSVLLNSGLNINFLGDDFLQCDKKFNKIVANPPFAKDQDIEHILKMYECLEDDGCMVSISSTSWEGLRTKKQKDFFTFLNTVCAKIYRVEAGAFKESGTIIETLIIKIDKKCDKFYYEQKNDTFKVENEDEISSFDELFNELEKLQQECCKAFNEIKIILKQDDKTIDKNIVTQKYIQYTLF